MNELSTYLRTGFAHALLSVALLVVSGCGGGGTAGTGTGEDALANADGPACTGILTDPGCPDGEYCQFPDGTCGENAVGSCVPRPEVCTLEFAPVCGCDGAEYGNACAAGAAGVSISTMQTCNQ